MIDLWELVGEKDCRYSTFAWRTRLALLHKGLPVEIHPVSVRDKDAIAFSGQDKVPIIKHDGNVLADSWAIAVYLEKAFPDRPRLFSPGDGEVLTHFFNFWVDRELIPTIVPHLMLHVLDCVDDLDAAHHRGFIEKVFKRSLEDLFAEREKGLALFRRKLQPVRKLLERTQFLGGDRPTYADYILFSVPQWARIVSTETIFEPGDPVGVWFERVLDLFDGVARREKPRSERQVELD